jgi:hypothetical protein
LVGMINQEGDLELEKCMEVLRNGIMPLVDFSCEEFSVRLKGRENEGHR